MTKLTRIGQFAIKQQADATTPATIAASDVVFEREQDGAGSRYIREMNARNPQRATLVKRRAIPGRGSVEHVGRIEVKPSVDKTTPPELERLLLASGLTKLTVKKLVTAGAATGTFIPGEEITDGGTKLGIFLSLAGTTLIYAVKSGSDFAADETLTGSLSGAEVDTHATTPTVTAIGFGYAPVTTEPLPFTAYGWRDGTRYRAVCGMANCVLEAAGAGELVYANMTFTGVPEGVPDDTNEFASGLAITSQVPQIFAGGVVSIDGASVCVDSLNFDLGNNVVQRRCASATYGVLGYRISDRNPIIRIDPEALPEGTMDFFTKYDTAEVFGYVAKWGATSKRCMIASPQVVIDQPIESGDREGIETYPIALKPVETDDYEYVIAFYDEST